ncbi:MAG: hypothetical protein LBG65_02530 [Puniceicoccales bacterium]|jgi:hypothetical protein|nr:hypothetical protein [Puniceicoccales bacterium]
MKIATKTIVTLFAFFFLCPLLRSQLPLQIPALAPPMIPQKDAGKHLPNLEKIITLYKEGRFFEFYEMADKVRAGVLTPGGRSSQRNFQSLEKEEIALLSWIAHYQLSAPLFSFETLEAQKNYYSRVFDDDFLCKISACKSILDENATNIAKMFSLDEKAYLRNQVENLARMFLFFSKVYTYAHDKKFHDAEDSSLRKKANDAGWEYLRQNRGKMVSSFGPLSRELHRHLELRGTRRFEMKNAIENRRTEMMNAYIRKLVKCFPRQGRLVQSHVLKAGLFRNWIIWRSDDRILDFRKRNSQFYSVEVDLSLAFGRALRDSKEYEWVYVGLPSPDKARKLMFEWMEKFNAETRKHNAIRKQRVAEAAAKKAAQNVKSGSDSEAQMRAAEAEALRIKNAQNSAKANAQESVLEISTASPLEKSGNPSSEKTDSPKTDNGGASDFQTKNDAVKSPPSPQEGAAKKK